MKTRIILMLMFVLTQQAYSQNKIRNGGFEELTKDISYYECPDIDLTFCNPFFYNRVVNWLNLYNTPEISNKDKYEGIVCAKLSANSNYFFQTTFVEGIFQNNLNLSPNKVYTISFKYKSINYGIVSVILSNILAHNNASNIPSNSSYPNLPDSCQFLERTLENINDVSWKTFSYSFIPNKTYTQIGFISDVQSPNNLTNASILLDDIKITESCCLANAIFNNTTNPPSRKVEDYIKIGPNVNFINSSNYYTAKNEILLANNTTIDGVSAFIAQAEDCLNKRVEFYQNIFEVHESGTCSFRVFLSACYGSGQYAFYFGEELSTNKYKDYPTGNAGNTITVKVVDLVTGEIVIKSITLPNKPHFTDSISVTIPNVFTPNGDGKNDYFRITDSNKTSYAYNATWFRFIVYNRWGNNILVQEGSLTGDDLNGFSDDVIYWNGRKENDQNQEELNAGTYYYILDIGNCLHTFSTRGSITLIRSSFREETSIDDEINSNANFPSEIYPNPTVDNLSLKLYNVTKNSQITITDILGKQLNIDCKLVENKNGIQEYNIDCSLLNNGIYFCNINKNGITETIKFSVIK